MSSHEVANPGPMRLTRWPQPDWLEGVVSDDERQVIEDVYGEQLEWGFAIPWMFRALNSPLTREGMLSAPRGANQREHATGLGYWTALLTLLTYSFGWARPDRGLRWWYDAGKPLDDPRLRMMAQVWDGDGQLDWFAAWLWTSQHPSLSQQLGELTGYKDDGVVVDVDPRWVEATRADADASGTTAPFGSGGYDLLHLSSHSSGPLQMPRQTGMLLRTDASERRAVLLLDGMIGWYRALVEHGRTLPDLGERSWHVDVVVRPVGLLGTFRRSRTTGLWFSGPHSLHVRGV